MPSNRRYKDTGMNSFWGHMAYESVVPEDHFLRALRELFDWDALGAELIELYEGRGQVGRPPYPPVTILKMLFLSYLYGLSERDTEQFVNENIPARYVLGLAMNVPAPDHSSLHVFRQRLLETDTEQQLEAIFDRLLGQARGHGLKMGNIQLLDSVHAQADVDTKKDKEREKKGKPPRDPDSRLVREGKRDVVEPDGQQVKKEISYRGYKTHISMDAKTRLITSLVPDWRNSADNEAFPPLSAHDLALGLPAHTYGGDRAYDDTDISERIEQHDMHVALNYARRAPENEIQTSNVGSTYSRLLTTKLRPRSVLELSNPLAKPSTNMASSDAAILPLPTIASRLSLLSW